MVELNKRFLHGYSVFKDEPRLQALLRNVLKYNRLLRDLGLRDHQVRFSTITGSRQSWGLTLTKGIESPKGELEDTWLIALPCWAVECLEYFRFAGRDPERTYLFDSFHFV